MAGVSHHRRLLAAAWASALMWLGAAACGPEAGPPASDERVGEAQQAIHSSHAGPAPWTHALTCYGGCAPPHYDPSACNHHTSCGPIANGNWWYATERAAFHCGAKLKLQRGNKCVVVDVQDNGPADWVEDNAADQCGTPYIIDTSPLVADYFGGGCGWGECFLVEVSPVPDSTPTGPTSCTSCACSAGDQQSGSCGNCGTRTRTCGGNCQWGAWSSCQGQGPCAAGTVESEPCCDCGTTSRTCTSQCQWSDWSGCAGPDPGGACATGEPGPCADGTQRCVEGCSACVSDYEPQPETCDAVDNDCSGEIDDGSPEQMGDAPPAYAARLVDASFPAQLEPGERGEAWATFRNEGSQRWERGQIWLAPLSVLDQEASALHDRDSWPAWDVAAVLEEDVDAGEVGRFVFTLRAPEERGQVSETFRLEDPDGELLRCPSPDIALSMHVGAGPAGVATDTAEPRDAGQGMTGVVCSATAPGREATWLQAMWLLLVAAALGRRRAR